MRQKFGHYFFSIIDGGLAPKIDGTELSPIASRPAAVVPRADDQEVLMLSIMPFEQFVYLYRAVKVFLVPPAGDV